jgi:hypothetical protein
LLYQTKLFYGYITNDRKSAVKYSELIIKKIEKDKEYIRYNINSYTNHKVNHLSLISLIKKKEIVIKHYNELIKFINNNININDKYNILNRIYSTMIFYFLNNGMFEDAQEFVNITSIKNISFHIDEPAKLSLLISHIWTHTILKKYSKALEELQFFINTLHTKNASEFYIISRIIYIIILFEKGDLRILNSICLNTLSQLNRINRLDDSLKIFLTFFSKLVSKNKLKSYNYDFNILKSQLLAQKNKNKLVIFNSLLTCAWIECKITGKNFEEIITERKFINTWSDINIT